MEKKDTRRTISYLWEVSQKFPPSNNRTLANKTAFTNGTWLRSATIRSTWNLKRFFFKILKLMFNERNAEFESIQRRRRGRTFSDDRFRSTIEFSFSSSENSIRIIFLKLSATDFRLYKIRFWENSGQTVKHILGITAVKGTELPERQVTQARMTNRLSKDFFTQEEFHYAFNCMTRPVFQSSPSLSRNSQRNSANRLSPRKAWTNTGNLRELG